MDKCIIFMAIMIYPGQKEYLHACASVDVIFVCHGALVCDLTIACRKWAGGVLLW
jgi:hypothetical protein